MISYWGVDHGDEVSKAAWSGRAGRGRTGPPLKAQRLASDSAKVGATAGKIGKVTLPVAAVGAGALYMNRRKQTP